MKYLDEEVEKLNKIDYLFIGIIVLLYAILSFYKLGDFTSPNTFFRANKEDIIDIELESNDNYKMRFYSGEKTVKFRLYVGETKEQLDFITLYESDKYFSWNDIILDHKGKYVRLYFLKNPSIGEIGFINKMNEIQKIKNISYNNKSVHLLSDEQEMIPDRISYMNSMYFDEIYFATTAYQKVFHLKIEEWTHPPLGKLIQAIPIAITKKMTPFNYRLMGNISGILLLIVMYIFGIVLFKKRKYALISMLLMALDTFHFAHTRMGTVDSHLVLMMSLSLLYMVLFLKKEKKLYMILSALFFSFSITIKWTGLYMIIPLFVLYLYRLLQNRIKDWKKIITPIILFIFLPIGFYISIYLISPNNLNETNTINNIILEQKKMYHYHSTLKESHDFSSKWYTWPISYKPVWYHLQEYIDTKETISGVGNIIIWFLGLISIPLLMIETIQKKDKTAALLLLTIIYLWIPYMFIKRVMFLYHFFPVLPFYFLSIVYLLKYIEEKMKLKHFIKIYLLIVLFYFMIYYPVVSGIEINKSYGEYLRLFSSWYF
ncbi:MAG: glycosyltransferase family 39 protein [Bacilli bacterium]|nr:glycosyltransferase family 39 protein [Bacilli bacterium]